MKRIIILALLGLFAKEVEAQKKVEKVWQTDTTLLVPESVRFDPKAKILYVSNIGIRGKDNTGFISKVGLDGKVLDTKWITGLTATKGLGLYKNLLYAAEPTNVAVIDIDKSSIVQRIPVEGAQLLNDITVDAQGIVYVSDFRDNKVYRIESGIAAVYLDNMSSANGLLALGSDLYILANNSLQKADSNKQVTSLVTGLETFPDGVEMVKPGEFIVTIYGGMIYYVKADGSKQILADTRQGPAKSNSGDLGFDPSTNTIYVPTLAKTIIAYKLID